MNVNHIAPYPYEKAYKKIKLRECQVAGLSYHVAHDDVLWDELEVGMKLALIRDKDNQHDSNAVAVALADDYDGDPENFDFDLILGYLPRICNSEIAAIIDAGYAAKLSAEVSAYNRSGRYESRILLTIFIESAEPEVVRPNLLRAQSLSLLELKNMDEQLSDRGTAYFRFGGFPTNEFQMPVVGEKIVMVHKDVSDIILYLMRVLATDDDCADYVEDPESIDCIDDCAPFILTNVMGPVRIKLLNWPFLDGVDLKRFSATDYLAKKYTHGFRGIFKSQLFKTLNCNNIDMDPSIDE